MNIQKEMNTTNGMEEKQIGNDQEIISRKPCSIAREQEILHQKRMANLAKARQALEAKKKAQLEQQNTQNMKLNQSIEETVERAIKRQREDFIIDEITAEDLGYDYEKPETFIKKQKINYENNAKQVEKRDSQFDSSLFQSILRSVISASFAVGLPLLIKYLFTPEIGNKDNVYRDNIEILPIRENKHDGHLYHGQSILK